jgi:hypothetical protein
MLYSIVPLSFLLTLSALPLSASKRLLPWQHGTVMEITGGSAQVSLNKRVKNKRFSKHKYQWQFAIDDGSSLIKAEYRGPKPLAVSQGALVSFAVSGDEVVLRDYRGNPHKLDLVNKTPKAGITR